MKKVLTVTVTFLVMFTLLFSLSFAQYQEDSSLAQAGEGKMGAGGGQGKSMGPEQMVMAKEKMKQRMKKFAISSFLLPMANILDLTDQQSDKLEKMKFQHQMEMIDKKAKLQKARLELNMMTDKPDMDIKAVESKMREIALMEVDMKISTLKAFNQCLTVLTPEQKKTLEELWKQKGKRKADSKGKMKGMMNSFEDENSSFTASDEEENDNDFFLTLLPIEDNK